MQNAHERFGSLEFIKRMKDTTTRVLVFVDRGDCRTSKGRSWPGGRSLDIDDRK